MPMFKLSSHSFTLIVLLLLVAGCGKYEEGPEFSLRTKTARVTGKWKIDKIILNGVPEQMVEDSVSIRFTFERAGDGKIHFSYQDYTFNTDLEWAFANDKEDFTMRVKDFTTGKWSEWQSSTIIKLSNKDMWLRINEQVDGEPMETETRFKKV
jgi:hypothetical protein